MGGFDKVTDLAQQLAGKEQTGQGQESQQDSSQISGSNQQWSEVGLEAKKVFANYQADQAAGKGPEYNKIGGVAQKAFSAYSSGGEKRDLAGIGKQVAAGFSGGQEADKVRNSSEVGDGMFQSGGGQRSFGTDESDVDGGDGKRGQKSLRDPLHSTTAEAKTSSKSERFSGQEEPYEAAGLGSQTERDDQDGTMFQKGDLDEDEGVCTGGQSKGREATSGTAANQGKKKNHTT
ncbi:uncharacterized protein LY79DRAFT_14873 [Colletotrichum navitas]|uniref:Uncharacterized protein n=1 Tax=Colletotrichum navitas TaxID=681940 RepID=A0AAD8QD35_9PEZI|nr:uncharacterized protein LY79DRAFT_14873 [Colletotrichum navitas]KAK1600330.1 hypothetical protein LY79DRAFT_14873 [Colletotrichum navitas]